MLTKKSLLLLEWKNQCGIITRKQAKSFYDCIHIVGLPKANPRFTGMNVIRILRSHGFYIGKIPMGVNGRMIDAWALNEFWEEEN